METYHHIQKSWFRWILIGVPLIPASIPFLAQLPLEAWIILWTASLFSLLPYFLFSVLKTEDLGDALDVRFGPWWNLGVKIRYSDIVSVSRDRNYWWEGWGIRLTFTGWLYNASGFDCVRINTEKRSIRVGTDDVEGLLALLDERTAS